VFAGVEPLSVIDAVMTAEKIADDTGNCGKPAGLGAEQLDCH
jgi:hypothetical protein